MKINKKGISLIVLVITIIVMIILATAIILSLDSSNIVDKAKEATAASDLANAKNVVILAKGEWELMDEKQRENAGNSFVTYAESKLKEAGYSDEFISDLGVNEDGTIGE